MERNIEFQLLQRPKERGQKTKQDKLNSKKSRRGNTNAGCMVWRGKDMNSFIVNWKPKNYT